MGATSIEWTDFSTNPIRARGPNGKSGHHCVKVSPGCKNCYSSKFQPRLGLPQFQDQQRNPPELFLDPKTLASVLRRRKTTKFFWCDMTDMFGEWVPDEWIAACFGVMAATPHHVHQVLTKRPERAAKWFEWARTGALDKCACIASDALDGILTKAKSAYSFAPGRGADTWPLPNVWLGTSVENRAALHRVDALREIPAAIRFLSIEPLLEDLGILDLSGIHWVIVGGESGRGARPFDIAWARSIIEQCKAAGVACFVKQLGARPVTQHPMEPPGILVDAPGVDRKGGDPSEWPEDLRVREFPEVRHP